MKTAVLADKHGVTHVFYASIQPRAGRNGRPACRYQNVYAFEIVETFEPPVPWPTCMACSREPL